MNQFGWMAAVIVVGIGLESRADRLVLRDGRVLDGTLVKQSQKEVTFRVRREGGISFTKTFGAKDVARVEAGRGDAEDSEEKKIANASGRTKRKPTGAKNDPDALLDEVLSAWENRSYRDGSAAVSTLLESADEATLKKYDEEAEAATDKTIAELAAALHLAEALERSKGGPISLKRITRTELNELADLLEMVIDEAIEFEIEADGQPPKGDGQPPKGDGQPPKGDGQPPKGDGQPPKGEGPPQDGFVTMILALLHETEQGLKKNEEPEPRKEPAPETPVTVRADSSSSKQSIVEWISDPKNYDGGELEIRLFSRHVQLALSLMRERIKYDPRLKKNFELKKNVLAFQKKTRILLSEAKARSKGELTEKEAVAESAKRKERFGQELRRRQAEEARRNAERLRDEVRNEKQQRDRRLRRSQLRRRSGY